MRIKRVAGIAVALVLALAAVAFHFVVGFVASSRIDERITVLTRKNVLSAIGGNVVVYSDTQGTIVVDTQLPPLAKSTRSKVNALIQSPINAVLVTHWHPDHSGGISAFSADTEVIAHQNVVQRLSVQQEGFGLTKPGSHHVFDARPDAGLPTKSFLHDFDVKTGSTMARVVHYPNAHTDGDMVVFFHDSKSVATGDLIWPGSFPYIDVHNGGTVAGLESALQAIIAASSPDYRFIPGHGATLTFEDVVVYRDMISATRLWVEGRLSEGDTISQIIASGLPAEWEQWSSSLVPSAVWIDAINASRAALDQSGVK